MPKKPIYRAGMILYHITDGVPEMLFMRPSNPKYGGDDFQCCKGKIDDGETSLEAAIREAQEEVGLFVPNIDGEIRPLGRFLGRTDFFVARVKDKTAFGEPLTPEEVDETRWMTLDQFITSGRKLHVPVVKAAKRLIDKVEADEANG